MSKHIDFTQGGIIRNLILFSIPLILGELFQNLYNSVDALIVGNFVNEEALAAVSVCSPIADLLVGFFNGMSIGSSVLVSRAFGAKDDKALVCSMKTSFSFSAVLGVALSLIGLLSSPLLLKLIGVQEDVFAQALIYLRIYLAGLVFTVIYNIGAGVVRAIGNSQLPFYILVFSCALNILLDIFFVVVFRLGIAGVGLATVFSQLFSVILIYRSLRKIIPDFHFNLSGLSANKKIIVDMLQIGLPTGLQSSLIQLSNLFIWTYINPLGKAAMSGIGVAQRLDKFVGLPGKALGLSMTTFISQNVGAKNHERNRKGLLLCWGLSIGIIAILSATVYLFAPAFVALFNDNPTVIQVGVAMMRTILPFYVLLVTREVFLGVLRGYGDTRIPMLLYIFGMIVFRQSYLAIAMHNNPSIVHIYRCYPAAWGVTTLLTIGYYLLRWEKTYCPD